MGKIFVITLKIFVVQRQDNCVNLTGSKKSLIFYIRLVEISLSILLESRKLVIYHIISLMYKQKLYLLQWIFIIIYVKEVQQTMSLKLLRMRYISHLTRY
ncbi:hypothetical protein RJ641_035451 [Dillenia turbinata]|uniref:Uncharacterized protein n=1 Tax=Dillenia turbinata TaxID=194707 RepID=A0AAN8ZEN3_9MAGN